MLPRWLPTARTNSKIMFILTSYLMLDESLGSTIIIIKKPHGSSGLVEGSPRSTNLQSRAQVFTVI